MELSVDKRREPRVKLSFVSVDVRFITGDVSPLEFCKVQDLSAGGMRFSAKNSYESGQLLRLTFMLPETNVSIRTDAIVVYQQNEKSDKPTGVQFHNLGLAERKIIREFIEVANVLNQKNDKTNVNIKNNNIDNNFKLQERTSDYNNKRLKTIPVTDTDNNSNSIVNQCVNGDRRAQLQFFRTYRDTVQNLIYRLLGKDYDLDDVLQQVFVQVFKSLKQFQGLSSLDTWVYRITAKICTDQLRKKYRKRKLAIIGSIDDNESGLTGVTNHTPHSGLENKELNESVRKALDKLTLEKRLVVVMYEIEGKSLEDIAVIIEKPVGTVKSRLFHGRKELVKLMGKYLD